jgi:hypothetical protein
MGIRSGSNGFRMPGSLPHHVPAEPSVPLSCPKLEEDIGTAEHPRIELSSPAANPSRPALRAYEYNSPLHKPDSQRQVQARVLSRVI